MRFSVLGNVGMGDGSCEGQREGLQWVVFGEHDGEVELFLFVGSVWGSGDVPSPLSWVVAINGSSGACLKRLVLKICGFPSKTCKSHGGIYKFTRFSNSRPGVVL